MNPRAFARRTRLLLPLAAVSLAVGVAVLASAGGAAAFSNCNLGSTRLGVHASSSTSPPCETFSNTGSAQLLDITQGDFSQLVVNSDPVADLELRVNLDPPINCLYQNRVYQGLSGDQYNVIVNGGSTVNEPTLHITLSSAVSGGLQGAQLIIYRGLAQVCFGSPRPFIPKPGSPLLTTNDPGIGVQYVGLLPDCSAPAFKRPVGPCINSRSASQLPTPTGTTGVVNVFFTVPPGWDPRIHG